MKIRRAIKEDSEFLFNLRNKPEVRLASWNSRLVEFPVHQKWLVATLSNPRRALYVAENESGLQIGQVRYDTEREGAAEIGVSVMSEHFGKGYGTKILVESAKIFFAEFPRINKIVAHIKFDNPVSVRVFSKAGYSAPIIVKYEGHDCQEMILTRLD